MDKIIIKDLEIFANHGVLAEENVLGQKFYVSCTMEVDTRKAGKSDDLSASVNYATIAHLINDHMKNHTYQLIETCCEKMAEEILLFTVGTGPEPMVKQVTLQVKKPWAPVGLPLDYVAVEITRGWHTAYIALGSNIGDSRALIEEAIAKVDASKTCQVVKVSTLIETEPYGVLDQPPFLNGMMEIRTLLTPHELLDFLHEVEKEAGRERKLRWGPRTLDLDITFYDDEIICDQRIEEMDDLIVPHIDMKNRLFVLEPLSEIAPYKVHPVYKKTVKEMLEDLK
ncbi:MAG: 2-amino-4-hydroxy-6-hydroxymethyldihydropteridine diphosphokinase [Dorea sp.]|nr:2-amino-4-hydroxy-6-hydroxymethyldihydropteridine diphosphokinase [Dorea sp.]